MKIDYNKCSTETLGYRFFVNVNFYLIIWTFNTIVKIIKFDRSFCVFSLKVRVKLVFCNLTNCQLTKK